MDDAVRTEVLKRLDGPVQKLLDKIENYLKRQVRFKIDPSLRAPRYQMDDLEIYVILNNEDYRSQIVLHELLHIHRFSIEKVPFLSTNNGNKSDVELLGNLTNTIEHMYIVPRETDFGYEPYADWNKSTSESLDGYPWGFTGPALNNHCFQLVMNLQYLDDDAVKSRAWLKIKESDCENEAKNLSERLPKLKHNRKALVSYVLKTMKIPHKEVNFAYFDFNTGKTTFEPVKERY